MSRFHIARLFTLSFVTYAQTPTITQFPVPSGFSPISITAGPDGNLWATGTPNAIVRFTAAGVFTKFTIPDQTGIIDNIYQIVAGPDGNLWFVLPFLNKVGKITPAGIITEFTVPTPDAQPQSITAGPDGNLWFTEFFGSRIGRITPSGTITELPPLNPNDFPNAIASGPDGNLWFSAANPGRIVRMTVSGGMTNFPAPNLILGLVPGPPGSQTLWALVLALQPALLSITTTGLIQSFPVASLGPNGGGIEPIVAGPDGAIWFIDAFSNAIGRITPSGSLTSLPVPTPDSELSAITLGPDGNIWFAGRNSIIGKITLAAPSVTPIPSTLTLVVAGFACVVALLAWKKTSK